MSTVPSSVAGFFRHVLFVLILILLLLLPLVAAMPAQGQTEGWRLSLGSNQTCMSRPGEPPPCWGENAPGVRDAHAILVPAPVAGLERAGPVAASGGQVCAVPKPGGLPRGLSVLRRG